MRDLQQTAASKCSAAILEWCRDSPEASWATRPLSIWATAHRLPCRSSSARSLMTRVSRSMLIQPDVDEPAEQLVHALSRAADHRGQVRLGIGPVELDAAGSVRVRSREPSRTSRMERRPARSRKWSSSTCPVRRRSSSARACSRACIEARVVIDEAQELLARQRQRLRRLDRGRRRRARRAVEQRQLTEEVAGS